MIRRLIKHQNMRVFPNCQSKRDPALLPPGKQILRPQLQISRDSERPQVVSVSFRRAARVVLHKLLQRREHQVQRVQVMLREN